MSTSTKQTTDQDVLDTMERYGGSFVKALAAAWRRADSENIARLRAAFPDIWECYVAMATEDAGPNARKLAAYNELLVAAKLITEDDPNNGPRLEFDSRQQFYILRLTGYELERTRAALANAPA